jgi:CRISPR-associated protein Cmr1
MSTILDLVARTGTPLQPSTVKPITCTVEVVTPMFLAGADNRAQREERREIVQEMVPSKDIAHEGLRATSVKAALRFWWRAGVDPTVGVTELARREAALFGSIAGSDNDIDGQGLTVRTQTLPGWDAEPPGDIGSQNFRELSYLAYGCADLNKALRPAIKSGSKAIIDLLPRQAVHQTDIQSALERWLLFGNMGAKSRRGWGALSDGRWNTYSALESAIKKYLLPATSILPDWSSMHGASVMIKDIGPGSWAFALNELGRTFHQFRKDLGSDIIGFSPKKLAQDPGKDHDRIYNWLNDNGMKDPRVGDKTDTLPDRAGFGLPYPLQFSSMGNAKVSLEPAFEKKGGRRASPVIFRVHRCNDRWYGLVTILAGRFLPENTKVRVTTRARPDAILTIPAKPQVLADFAAYLTAHEFARITP